MTAAQLIIAATVAFYLTPAAYDLIQYHRNKRRKDRKP